MKKHIVKFLALAAALTTLGSSATALAAEGQQKTCTQANEICEVCYQGYNEGQYGPVVITKGELKTKSWFSTKKQEVYLIALSGTEMVENQSTGYLTDLKVGFNQNNPYLRNVVSIIKNRIPKDSKLILAGHSLGGMVAQQVAANKEIKNNYEVLNTVTFGSPLISGSREGTVKRLGDTSDVIPYLSVTGEIVRQVGGLNRESGNYGVNAYAAHVESYLRSDVWGAYDVTGTKNGNAELTLDLLTQTYFQSPVK